jgi:hypothetical protein
MRGRWDSPQIEEFYYCMLSKRTQMYQDRVKDMFKECHEHARDMRPNQQCTNLELVTQEFAYIDRLLLDTYVAHFMLASEIVHVECNPTRGNPFPNESHFSGGAHMNAPERRKNAFAVPERKNAFPEEPGIATFIPTHASLDSDGSISLGGYIDKGAPGTHAPNEDDESANNPDRKNE